MQTTTQKGNEFLSSRFDEQVVSFPYAQVLNEKSASDSGFFITTDNLATADWQLPQDQQFHQQTWHSGEKTMGLLIHHPRLIILAQSPMLMFERESGSNLGVYNAERYRQSKGSIVIKTKYLVYFVDKNNQLRHKSPMQLTMKGAAGASFGEHLIKFRLELEKAFAIAHQQQVKRKSLEFHAMGVFCIQTEPQVKGEGQKAGWVCSTVNHEQPTPENYCSYFVGFTTLKERLLSEVEQYAKFTQLQSVEPIESTPINNTSAVAEKYSGEITQLSRSNDSYEMEEDEVSF